MEVYTRGPRVVVEFSAAFQVCAGAYICQPAREVQHLRSESKDLDKRVSSIISHSSYDVRSLRLARVSLSFVTHAIESLGQLQRLTDLLPLCEPEQGCERRQMIVAQSLHCHDGYWSCAEIA